MSSVHPARDAAEYAARESYGRLLAWLAYRSRDLAAAQDALADAFVAALTTWPLKGIPDSPDAWLMAAAKRNLLHMHRHQSVVEDPAITILLGGPDVAAAEPPLLPDQRLKLLFVCAHPAIDERVRTPLMLQTVLGLDARQIAAAFLVSPATMAQRLVRAKAKIKDARIRYEEPEARELPRRMDAVLEGIYAAYGAGWNSAFGVIPSPLAQEDQADGFTSEALYLSRLTVELMPASAEAKGLLALLMFTESRRAAQVDRSGGFIPLDGQDVASWDLATIRAADQLLWRTAQQREPGRFQLEAAIQSAHCQRAFTGATPWIAISSLYGMLERIAPSIGVVVNRAVALGETGQPQHGLDALAAIAPADVSAYQPYWVARAHLNALAGHGDVASDCYLRAIGLTEQASIRAYLRKCMYAPVAQGAPAQDSQRV